MRAFSTGTMGVEAGGLHTLSFLFQSVCAIFFLPCSENMHPITFYETWEKKAVTVVCVLDIK